ncbi:terminal uridylyltransferase 7-like [Stegodyphus dumicola]|uniref:terminal uridylyltransferase 7-like n=1 Tax=Stegodyphus dumicola TaxID=202533 RepID=UPI0015A8641B|nr:terminal uridylyltransferase 7-like [Stegodyphus dumicola]
MVLKDLNKAIKGKFPGSTISLYGSYSCDLAVSTSNINFALQTKCKVQNSLLLEIKKCLSRELEKYDVLPFDEAAFVKKSKICVIEPYTGMVCELMYLGRSEENAHKIASLLKSLCAFDHRIKTLFIAARIWAEVCSILEAEDGKLPPIAFSVMIIHFLQQLEKPLLPIIDIFMESWGLKNHQKLNTSTLGELWLEFLNYYQTFNWEDHVVSVLQKHPVLKSSKSWNTWIAVEDPFSQKNIAESVNSSDVANLIKSCFAKFYGYFSLPPNVQVDGDSLENREGKRRYSFSSCDLQCASTCERCENLGKTCEGCLMSPTLAIEELPELSPSSMEKVDRVLLEVYENYILPEKKIVQRKAFVQNLEVYVKKVFRYAQLTLFGSSANGFGFKASDLDICMILKNRRKENTSPRQILMILRNHLRRNKEFKNILVVWRAQIPIIKFYCIPSRFRCEISLYNILAVHNSVLLHTYSLLDDRCKILGCALKLLAKKASIAETVSRTLSSYSYILMVIHYLQQVKPPVLPVLRILDQNVFEESLDIPTEIAEKNDWLCKDTQTLKTLFNKESRNESSVGQLWLGLLKFYIQIKSDYVISIRQKEAVPISELPKSSSLYNIQDPFLYKNLGCIVSENKASTIWATLNRARSLFGKEIPSSVKDLKAYYFASMNLTGKFISDEECELCGKFGHSKNNCPNN